MAVTDDFIISVQCSGPGSIPLNAKTTYNVVQLTAANFSGTMTNASALATAYAPLTLGVISQESVNHSIGGAPGYPSSPANRGSKWIVTAKNANGDLFTHTIPALNPGALNAHLNADGVTANLTNADWVAYVTAFGAVALSPAGDALSLVRAKTGGRRR